MNNYEPSDEVKKLMESGFTEQQAIGVLRAISSYQVAVFDVKDKEG